jgi:hypothetical protein
LLFFSWKISSNLTCGRRLRRADKFSTWKRLLNETRYLFVTLAKHALSTQRTVIGKVLGTKQELLIDSNKSKVREIIDWLKTKAISASCYGKFEAFTDIYRTFTTKNVKPRLDWKTIKGRERVWFTKKLFMNNRWSTVWSW